MSTPQAQGLGASLALVARASTTLRELVGVLGLLARHNRAQEPDHLPTLRRVSEDLQEATQAMLAAGVRLPERGPLGSPLNPLAELVKQERSRSEALALLEALRAALPRAEDLDTVRGDVLAEPVNGLRGLVWGEELCQLIARLELELYGPSERVTGGRE